MRISSRTAALIAILAAAGAAAVILVPDDKPAASASSPTHVAAAPAAPSAAETQAAQQGPALPERSGLGEPKTPLFATQSWQPPPPKAGPPPPPPKPTAPPLPFKFAGRMFQDGQLFVFLARGDAVITAKQGDTVDGAYRVDSISETEVALTYVPLGQKQSLAVVSSLPAALPASIAAARPANAPAAVSSAPAVAPRSGAASPIPTSNVVAPSAARNTAAPAQLEWGGPDKVKLGTRFDVTLRVKSDESLHAWPMQLRFDPSVLEVVTVKPGRSLGGSEPTFGYRVNPDGSIFVGASAQSGTAASNAELVVLTLKSVKATAAAELNVTSLTLQGASGRPIAHERIAAFKTAVTP